MWMSCAHINWVSLIKSVFKMQGARYIMVRCVYAKSLQLCPTLCDPRTVATARLPCPRDSPGKNTGMGFHALSRGLSLCLLDLLCWQAGSYP